METSAEARNLRRWQRITLIVMIVGYAGYYLCRSNLSVARPLIIAAYPEWTKAAIGTMTAAATLLYAFGKFIFGGAADVWGGRRMFLFGMVGAVACTLLFGLAGPPVFWLAWCGNRFVQSSGWVGMVKVTSRWFGADVYGRAMAMISLSFLFGDFASRRFLGALIRQGMGWQQLFVTSALVLAAISVPTFFLMRNSPAELGLREPAANPEALVPEAEERKSVGESLKRLLGNRRFLLVCVLSFGFTFMRETFNDWTPTYLHEVAKLSEADAADASSYFPLFGGLSVIAVGFLTDRFGPKSRTMVIGGGLLLAALGLAALGTNGLAPNTIVALVAGVGFVLIGPYSLLAGAISLDFGGKAASASAAGWIDGIGYLGGILSGYLIAQIAEHQGWTPAFTLLAGVAAVSSLVAFLGARLK